MRLGRLLPTVFVLALALPGGVAAADFERMFDDYKSDGRIDGCYKPLEIHNAQQSIPPDIEQYAPGFGDALSAAQAGCSNPGRPAPEEEEADPAGGVGPNTPAVVKKRAVTDPPAPKQAAAPLLAELPRPQLAPATGGVAAETPGALVALLVAAGIAVLLALAWALAWLMGWSPERFTRPLTATFESLFARR